VADNSNYRLVLPGAFGKPGLAGSSPGRPLGDAPVPILPGVEVFGAPATGGAVARGEVALDPVVPVPADGMAGLVGAPVGFPGVGVPGLSVAPPAVCAFA
jgi:hypothetical protein